MLHGDLGRPVGNSLLLGLFPLDSTSKAYAESCGIAHGSGALKAIPAAIPCRKGGIGAKVLDEASLQGLDP
jgi:hypothetical protein